MSPIPRGCLFRPWCAVAWAGDDVQDRTSLSGLPGLSRVLCRPATLCKTREIRPFRSRHHRHRCPYRRCPGGATRAESRDGRARVGGHLPLRKGLSEWDPSGCGRSAPPVRPSHVRALKWMEGTFCPWHPQRTPGLNNNSHTTNVRPLTLAGCI